MRTGGSSAEKSLCRTQSKLQPAVWPCIMPCCIQVCIYPTSANRSQSGAFAFSFSATRNACSSEKILQARGWQQPERFVPFLACFLQSPASAPLLQSQARCYHTIKTPRLTEHPQPGTACKSFPVNRHKPVFWSWDSCVSSSEESPRRGESCMSLECLCSQEPCIDFSHW